VGGKIDARTANDYNLLHLREQKLASAGRMTGGGAKPVVAAGIQFDDGGAGEAAETIGLEPLVARGQREIGQDRFRKLDHEGKRAGQAGKVITAYDAGWGLGKK